MQHAHQLSLRRFIILLSSLIGLLLILMGSSSVHATGGTSWTSQTSPADNSWGAVTYGNGKFVAVSNTGPIGGRVMTSSDGRTWTLQTAAAASTWLSVTYGNGKFVAVSASDPLANGSQQVMTSTDGVTWVSQSSAT